MHVRLRAFFNAVIFPKLPSKQHLLLVGTIGLALSFIGILMFLKYGSSAGAAGWYSDDWQYRQRITVTNNTTTETNVYVSLTVSTADTTRFQGDCGDVRFVKENGEVLPYYISSGCGGASTVFHIFFDSLIAGPQDMYLYYGNSAVTNGGRSSGFSTVASNYSMGSPASEETTPGILAAWQYDEGTGTTAYDQSSNANHGTLTNGPAWQTTDKCMAGKCLFFDGSDDYVSISDESKLEGMSAFTISAWVRLTQDTGNFQMVASKFWDGTDRSWYLAANSTTDLWVFQVATDTNNTNNNVFSTTSITNQMDQWVFLTGVWDSVTDTSSLYINGRLEASLSTSGNSIRTNAAPVYIGRDHNNGSPTYYFNGYIDQVRVYPYARSTAQINADYAARGTSQGVSAQFGYDPKSTGERLSNGLIAYYPMDEAAANTCSGGANDTCDKSGNVNDAAWNGNASNTSGKYGNAIGYDGAGDYLTFTQINAGKQNTTGFWINYQDSGDAVIIGGNGSQYAAYIDGASAGSSIYYRPDTGSSYASVVHNGLTSGVWYYFTIVRDGLNVTFYKNGEPLGATQTITGDNDLQLQSLGAYSGGSFPLQGSLDEVRIYNRAFSPAEVRALYQWAPGPVGYWKFDENTGTATKDTSGNLIPTTLKGTTTQSDWIPGKIGSAHYFDDGGTEIDSVQSYQLGSEGTYATWVKRTFDDTAVVSNQQFGYIFDDNSNNMQITYQHSSDQWAFIYEAGDTVETISFSPSVIPRNTWTHVAFTWSKQNDIVTVYINGIAVGTSTSLGTFSGDNSGSSCLGSSGANCNTAAWSGALDDARIYNYARTPAQIIEDMNGGHPVGGSPIGSQTLYLKFNEGYGDTAYDSSPLGNNGDLAGSGTTCPQSANSACPSWSNSGKFGKALNFDTSGVTDDYVQIANESNFDITNNDFTLSLWMKRNATGAVDQHLINKPGASQYYQGNFSMQLASDGDGDIGCNFWVSGITWVGVGFAATNDGSEVSDTNWHHIACTFNFTEKRAVLYKDGIPYATSTWTTQVATANDNSVILGAGNASNGLFNGLMDEVKIYRAALTPDQIKTEYNGGKSLVLGSTSTGVGGTGADNSAARGYCVPGDQTSCSAPIHEYTFNENTGTTVYDTGTATARNGTLTLGPSFVPGKYASAIKFDGIDSYIDIGANELFDETGAFTVSAWVYPISLSTYDTYIVCGPASGGPCVFISASWQSATNAIHYCSEGTCTSGNGYSTNNAITLNQWQFITVTYDGTSACKFYVNGQDVTNDGTCGETSSSYTHRIGGTSTFASSSNAILEQLRTYDYARTPAQIAWEYSRGAPVAWYKFDECQGSTVSDWSKSGSGAYNENNGTITISATGTNTGVGSCGGSAGEAWADGATGKYGASLDFDGSGDFVSSSFDIDNAQGTYSIASWVKTTSAAASQVVSTNAAAVGYSESVQLSAAGKALACTKNTSNSQYCATSTTSVNDGNWHFIVSTVDWTNSVVSIYVDGKLEATQTPSGTRRTDNTTTYIGRRADGGSYVTGQIDDVRIFNYPLTAAQIKQVMNNGAVSFR